MNYLNHIQRGVDYIEAHLERSIAIDAVARATGMSQWHFQRVFKALTGDTVKNYIRSRRLGLTLHSLLNSRQRVIDLALAAGFESQASFTRAFKAAFGTTPAQYRRAGKRRALPVKLEFSQAYLEHINQGMDVVPEIYQQEEKHFIGLRSCFYGPDSDRNNLAAKLPPLWQQFLARLSDIEHAVPGTCYGIVRQLSADSDELEYFCAMEVRRKDAIPDGMHALTTPACTYAKFAHKGPVDRLDHTVDYIYSSWLARSGRQYAATADLEFYGAAYHPTSPESVIHYAIPIV